MKFKTPRIESEYARLNKENLRLYNILLCADLFSIQEFKKEIILTEIYRTPEETKELYKEYASLPTWRPHENWLGADLRSFIYSDREIERLVNFLNQFVSFGGQRKTAVYHAIKGGVAHFHVQTNKP